MKRFLIIPAVFMAVMLFVSVEAQTPAFAIAGGTTFENGQHSHVTLVGDYRFSIKTAKDSTGNAKAQAYTRLGFVRSTGIGLDPELSPDQLEAGNVVGMVEYYLQDFFVGVGIGGSMEFQEGQNPKALIYAFQLGWQPIREVRLYAGCDYYNREKPYSNLVGVYTGLALDLKHLVFE